jgi:hypothetical protein
MKLASSKTEAWFPYQVEGAPKDETPAQFKIRRIPAAKAREVELVTVGRKRVIRLRNQKNQEIDFDVDKNAEGNRELAVWALLDAKDATTFVETEALAKALGIPVGTDDVPLDGRLSSEAVKVALLDEIPGLTNWVLARSASMHAKVVEEAEGKD